MSKKDPEPNPFNFAIGADGQLLPFTPVQIGRIVAEAIRNGSLLAAVFRINDDLAVQVFGPPSRETAKALEQAALSYRKMFRDEPFRG